MNNIFSKLRDFVGLNEQVEYEYYEEEAETENYQNLYQQENPHNPRHHQKPRLPIDVGVNLYLQWGMK